MSEEKKTPVKAKEKKAPAAKAAAPKKEKATATKAAPKKEAKVKETVAKVEAPKKEAKETVAKTEVPKKAKVEKPVAEPVAEPFDWSDTAKSGFALSYSAAEKSKLEALYSETLTELPEKEVISGTVTAINENDVIVNVNYKCDGVLPKSEFRSLKDLKVGDEVDVYVEATEDKLGQLVLSRSKAKIVKAWENIYAALDTDLILEGLIKRRTKGGLIMDLDGVEAFLPGSQIDVKPIRDFDVFVGKTMEVKVVKINAAFENVVVSHKMLIEKDLEAQRSEIIKNLDKGQVLEGVIKNMTNFGVFIDLGGLDGLLHITDISWGRVNHPEDVLKLDEKVKVVVLDFDDDKNRISLGMKQLEPHPWDALDAKLEEEVK